MMELRERGDGAMNLLGLILLAALSGGIVAVSLRLRPSSSSGGMWPAGDRLPEGNPFGLRGERDSINR